MSIKGSPLAWFEAAIQRRDLAAALSEAPELAPLTLDWALELVVLAGERGHARYPRWAARWLARLIAERPDVNLALVHSAAALLAAVPDHPVPARAALQALLRTPGR